MSDTQLYLVWGGLGLGAGMSLALAERRWFGRHWLWVLLSVAVIAGWITTKVSPFTFHGGDHFFLGFFVATGAGLALAGYVATLLALRIMTIGRGRQ